LSFGSESGDAAALWALADFASSGDTEKEIHALMDQDETLSFARARQLIAGEKLGERAALLSNPNDILAVEYLKALRRLDTRMELLPIRRTGAGHDRYAAGEFRSAMQLREMTERGEDASAFIPEAAGAVFRREREAGRMGNRPMLEIALLSRLYRLRGEDFDRLPDAGGGAGRRLYGALRREGSLGSIAQAASSKRYTAARMRRMLLCAALGLYAEDTMGAPPYIRILAANERGRACLAEVRGKTAMPVVNRASEVRGLDEHAQRIFTLGAEAHALYQLQFVTIDDRKPDADWKTGVAIV